MQLSNTAAAVVSPAFGAAEHWLDQVCQPVAETQSQQVLSHALSERLQQVLELYDDFVVAYDRYISKRGPRPEAALLAVLRLVDVIRPSDIDVLIHALKRLEVIAQSELAAQSLNRLSDMLDKLDAEKRFKVSALLAEINRLEMYEKGEYKECFIRIRRDEIARLSPAVYGELATLENSIAGGRIAKLNVVKLMPLFIRYQLAKDTEDMERATELIAEMGQFSQLHLTLFGLHLTSQEMQQFDQQINNLRRRNIQMFQMKNWTEAARQSTRLEQEIAVGFSALPMDIRMDAQRAFRMFETAENTIDEMVALSDVHKVSPELAIKAKEWRSLTADVCQCRKLGQQMERVQHGVSVFGPGYAPPQMTGNPEFVQSKEIQEITTELPAFKPAFESLLNCMDAVMSF